MDPLNLYTCSGSSDSSDRSDSSDKQNSVTIFFAFFLSLKLWQNLKTQIVTKPKNLNCDKTQKHKFWQNSKNSNCDKTQKFKLWQN